MKQIRYFLILIFVITFIGCENKLRNNVMQAGTLAQYRDSIIGRFNGIETDTLISEPIDTTKERAMWDWRIFSKRNSVDTLILTQRFNVRLIQEGDLDGNGTDEFGVRRESDAGTWDNYYIYTFSNGAWKCLINPVWTYSTHFYDELRNGEDVAEKTSQTDFIRVRYSDVRNDGEDFLIIDTLIKVNMQPIQE